MAETKRAATAAAPVEAAISDRRRPGLGDDPFWYKDAVIYQVHVRGFFDSNNDGVGDFAGLTQKLDYIQALGVSAIWLQPFYPSPLKDDGYDIAHYEGVHPSYGTRRDFTAFLAEAHERGLRVITELVINHTSDQHPWFQAARRAKRGSSKRNFYVWNDDDRKYAGVPIVFKDTERSNWTWDPVAGQYFWHRFFHHQPDLNFDNPLVRKAVVRVMRFWLDAGVDGMRLDAVPYLVEREGTQCANLPETHAVLKEIRRELDAHYTNRMLLAEANQWPSDVRAYFGEADECHMAFHFPLMPRLFMALRQEDRHPLSEILWQMPEIPESCQWAIFLRNHDELTLEMVSDEERDYMYQAYAADPQMRINVGIRRRLAPLMENSRPRIELMTSLLLSLPGTPVLYYGDELGMGDNIYLGDRNSVRTPMQWNADRNGGFSRAEPARLYTPPVMDSVYGYASVNVEAQDRSPHSLLSWMRRAITLRQQHVRTFGRGTMELLRPLNRRIFAFVRRYDADDPILVVANLSRTMQPVSLDLSAYAGLAPVELAGNVELPRIGDSPYVLTLGPYASYWLRLQREVAGAFGTRPQSPADDLESDDRPLLVGPEWARLVDSSVRQLLERRFLAPFLRRQSWFEPRASALARVVIQDWGVLGDGDEPVFLLIVTAVFENGDEAVYAVPLAAATGDRAADIATNSAETVLVRLAGARQGVLHARLDGPAGRLLMRAALAGESFMLRRGRLVGFCPTDLPAAELRDHLEELAPAPFDRERFHSSAAFGEQVMLKLVRRLWPDPNPERERLLLVNRSGFDRAPALLCGLEYRGEGAAPATMALLNQYVPHQADGWRFVVGDLQRFLESEAAAGSPPVATSALAALWTADVPDTAESIGTYVRLAAVLGQRSAELHAALAKEAGLSDLPADAVVEHATASWDRVQDSLRAATPQDDATRAALGRLLNQHTLIAARLRADRRALPPTLAVTATHGALNLAHVLLHEDNFVFIGFADDNAVPPDVRLRARSPLEDIATLLRSIYAAGSIAAATMIASAPHQVERLTGWSRWATACAATSLLGAYAGAASNEPWWPGDARALPALIRIFVLQQLSDEIPRVLMKRPGWLSILLGELTDVAGV